ncbi:ABC transporter ATP-binding protein [Billgrantia kenyensis]|uniref:ABC transporter ATP-binding protein n=1 Tax=Billgrantia kenyensis TaxID=321266 RepID=A0A7W0ADF2_9GAMM|nr:ABC transporter ATP-binding protein [Halomonas kenyensis]MBA2778988.1 ABC transporter ATP-binding protein [Halomonas kenyensis]MCG6662915.1 ABC transporter ATP-binding protein [Halomonas kenyensis]
MSLMIVDNLGKAYRTYKTEWHRFGRWLGIPCQPNEEHWVLRHLNFEIQPGEAIGIVGQNGAGKSTLLKMITGTLQPTEGSIQVNGRIAAILELGMGFNPELSGRENVFHAAGLMGFSTRQIQKAMPDVEAFAEIGEYFDQPVRTYSSGMQMRVAFAVATAYRPEILIVDEALSVGDSYFQHKSFNRIREFQEQGTTLMIVSHDRSAIQSLCDRAILLEQGRILKDGSPEEIFDFYNALIAEKEKSTIEIKKLESGRVRTISGTGEAKIKDINLFNEKREKADFVEVGESVFIKANVVINANIGTLVFGYSIKDKHGQIMYGTNTWHTKQIVKNPRKGDEYTFLVSFPANLGPGTYSVQTALVDSQTHLTSNYEWQDLALVFDVVNSNQTYFDGSCWIEPSIRVEKA